MVRLARVFLQLLALGAILAYSGCRSGEPAAQNGISVTASFYPLYEAARQIGGDRASVKLLVPPGTEPHDFDPTPQDIVGLLKAKVIVYNGAGLEPWLERLLPDLEKKGIVLVNASNRVRLLEMSDEEDPLRKVPDPHFWLDPVYMQEVVLGIRDSLIQAD
ncbi:MAG: zinc ABC transporter substrate-binding protein, partial [Chloroflexota bacterium]|nr:zinc ABC transporter substrate-binding protein [Chloroflexota bacterium]